MPSSAAVSEADASHTASLMEAAQELLARGAFSAIWLDATLRVTGTIGAVPAGVVQGALVDDALEAFVGLGPELTALRQSSSLQPLRIPNIAVTLRDGRESQRLNISVFWVAASQRFLVLFSTIIMQSPATDELDQEIRRRRLIEQDLAARSLEYERINQQLEEFAYVISHDLNAPLRAIRYLTGDVEAAIAAATDAATDLSAASGGLAAIREGTAAIAFQTRRMSRMMTDLLEYARIGRVAEASEPVDTAQIIADIVATLQPTTALSLVTAGAWPTIETAAAPLDLVLRNLVENAVKHHDRRDGRVTIEAATGERFVEFRIIDDGRGIAPEWHAAIFEPFRKVDDAHHPDSSGIGLALVKKTVATLGGAIAVYSDAPARRGATFVVKWPLRLAIAEDPAVDFR